MKILNVCNFYAHIATSNKIINPQFLLGMVRFAFGAGLVAFGCGALRVIICMVPLSLGSYRPAVSRRSVYPHIN